MSLTILKSFSLDFAKASPLEYVYAKQGDQNSRILEITPLNDGAAYTITEGTVARFGAKKPDGTQILNDAVIENGKIYVTLTAQALAVSGVVTAEITLYGASDELLSSQHFHIMVERFAIDPDAVESSDEYGSFETALLSVERAESYARQAQEAAASVDLTDYYNKMQTNNLLLAKANKNSVYTKNEVDAALSGKADAGALGGKQDIIDNTLETVSNQIPSAINEVNSIAKGAQKAISYGNYQIMITAFNALASTACKIGQSIFIVTLDVPDLWISGIENNSVTYTYTTDEAFTTALQTYGYVQVGYYKISALETGKVDLSPYYTQAETNVLLASKLKEPSSNLAVGKYFRIASIDLNGHAVLECVDAPSSPVQSISTADSLLTPDANGDVRIPTASGSNLGLVKSFGSSYGVQIVASSGLIFLTVPTDQQITDRSRQHAVVLSKLDQAVKTAMTDGVGAAWTDAERLAALSRMGCTVDSNGFVKFTSQE